MAIDEKRNNNNEKEYSYQEDLQKGKNGWNSVEESHVEEASYYHAFGKGKKQGEYTLEDYYALPDEQRVELIDGVIYDMSAPSLIHQGVIGEIFSQIKNFIRDNKGTCRVYDSPVDVQLDCDDLTMVQPDLVILCDKEKMKLKCIYGAPDFVLEVLSPSTSKKDCNLKLRKYMLAGVKEYWILDPDKERLLVYEFEKDNNPTIYGLAGKVPVGIYKGRLLIDLDAVKEWGWF